MTLRPPVCNTCSLYPPTVGNRTLSIDSIQEETEKCRLGRREYVGECYLYATEKLCAECGYAHRLRVDQESPLKTMS